MKKIRLGEPRFSVLNIPLVVLLALVAVSCAHVAKDAKSISSMSPPAKKIRVVLVGDSTVTERSGWGVGFKQFIDTNQIDCINAAAGGRSSMSYMKEGRWTNALVLKGDYYLIQFAHNNEPGRPGRSTDMPTFVSDMNKFVDDARAIGAKPVLVTPLTRRQWAKGSTNEINSSLAPYAEEVRKIAAAKNVPLLELHDRSRELCESLGREKCQALFSPMKTVDGTNTYDHTHLRGPGRVMFARIVVEELRRAVPELAPALRAEPRNANPPDADPRYNAIVATDGSGAFTNLQDAIADAPDNGGAFTILIKPGTYQGQFIVPKEKQHIKFVGTDTEKTILTGSLNQNEPSPDGERARYNNASTVILGDDFRAENITFQNTSGDHGQALAMRADGDREVFKNCRFLGWQDTLLVNKGRYYFTNCYVEGRVDFIYGNATAVFDRCEIRSKNGGHVTAANTPQEQPFGFVFLNCKLTGDPQPWINPTNGIPANTNSPPKADLGRPWRPYASVTYLNCELGDHIKPEGWNNWRNPTNELTARFAEYQSIGPGANPAARFKWARQLTDEEAKAFTVENVLRGEDGWNPAVQ